MAQKMIDINRMKKSFSSVATQTSDSNEFIVNLSKSKHARLYYSESYKEVVLSLNINRSKAFIITKSMWTILRKYLLTIDKELMKNV